MNTSKKIISILMCVLMVMSMLTVTASAAVRPPVTPIDFEFTCEGVKNAVPGSTVPTKNFFMAPSRLIIESVGYTKSGEAYTAESFEEGNYTVNIVVSLANGDAITESFNAKLNDKSAKVAIYPQIPEVLRGKAIVSQDFTVSYTYIDPIELALNGYEAGKNITEITATENAEGAKFLSDMYGAGYYITDAEYNPITDENASFEYDEQYYLAINLKALSGYGFDLTEADISLKDYVCDVDIGRQNTDELNLFFKLPKLVSPNTVSEIKLTLNGYEIGEPLKDITVSTDAIGIELADDGYVNKCAIYGSTDTKPDHTVFLPGETYRLAVCFEVKSGYEFYLDDVAEIFNLEGATFESIKKNGNYYTAIFALPVLESEKITQVEIGLTAPVVGENPDLTLELPADAAYYLSDSLTGIQWRENGVSGSPLPYYYEFKTIYTYNVTVSLLPKAGYEFADASVIVATINGKNAQVRFVDEKIILTYEFGKALCTEHNWKNADCNNPKTCRKCGATEGVALGHSWANADCDTPKTCNTCGTTEGVALGHSWANADCDTPKTCNTCGATEGVALGHSWTNADCDTPKTCNTCGATEGTALGHTGGTATCEKKAQCTVCGEQYGELASHTGGTATCTEKAKCSVCGEAYGSVNKDNHKSLTTIKAVAATCTKTGLTEGKKCTDCGVTTVAQKTVAKKAHTLTTLKAVAATYKADGKTEGKKCADCGTVTVAQKKVARKTLKKVSGLKTKAVKLASGTKTSLTLSWSKVTGAEKYQVQQYVNKKWKTIKTTSKTSYTVTKLKANKSYKFRVRAVAGKYYGKYSSTYTAKTVPLKTTLTLKAGKKALTASWKTVANITGYEVTYSTSKKFSKKTTKTVTIKNAKTKKTTIKKLSKGKKYYVKVRAYKTVGSKKIYSAWSSVKNVKVK